jgi:large subunit ribosomal protein L33
LFFCGIANNITENINAINCVVKIFYAIFANPKLKVRTMAKKTKDARVQVILECTEHKKSGMPGTSRYITTKNRKNSSQRIEMKKYNPILKKHTVHKEIK